MRAIAFDATPLTPAPGNFGGHAARGIGRYLAAVLRSLATQQSDWAARHLLPVRTADTELGWWPGETVVTRRIRRRSQDTGWWTAPVLDSIAGRTRGSQAWHATDPAAPLAPWGQRSIVTAYDLIPLADPRVMGAMRGHRRLVYRLYLQRLRQAHLVVAISHTTAGEVERRLGVPRDRIAVVYPGLAVAAAAASATPHVERPDLLFVGVPQPHKNAPQAIDALAELRRRGHDIRLRLAGPQPQPARQALTRHAQASGVAAHLDWLGIVDDARLTELYRASVLLALSGSEGLGLTPLEALAAGGRAICGSAAAFRETLGNAGTYADQDLPMSVADAYEELVARPPTGLPGEVVERFSPAASARASIAAYERVLS